MWRRLVPMWGHHCHLPLTYFSKLIWKWSKILCLCHDLPENKVTSKLSGQFKCTSEWLESSDIIVSQGSMAHHFMEMECKVWWYYYDFCLNSFSLFIFLCFLWGGRVFKLLNIYFFFIIYCQDLWLYITSQNLIVSTVGTVREDLSLHGIRGKVILV